MTAASRKGTISVVVPSYNHGHFLRGTLRSALEQTLPPDELVVVDDGSSDDSARILESIDDPRLRVELQENRGAHAAINRAIELSRGDFVAILNSDDLFEPERLEHAWGVATSAGALLVCGEVRLIGDDGGEPPADHDIVRWYAEARALGRDAPSLAGALRRHNVAVTTSNFFLHRALWRRLGGFRAWRYVHDYDFLLRAMALCPERIVYEPSLCDVRYRVHGANTISESHERALDERDRMLRTVRAPSARARAVVERVVLGRALAREAADVGIPDAVRVASTAEASTDGPTAGLVVRSLGEGGLEEIVALLAEALPRAGVGVTVHCLDAAGPVADRLRARGVPVAVGDGTGAGCARWARAERVSVISGHHLPVEVVQTLASDALPVVETLHNTFAWYGPEAWAREHERIEGLTDAVAVSDTVAAYYGARTGYRAGHVISNAVHPGRVTAVPRGFARRALGVSGAGPVFAAVGRLAGQKNLPALLRAFARVRRTRPDARLLLAGPRDPAVSPAALRRFEPEVFASGAVRWLGARRDVGTVLCAADAYVSAAFYEGWSVAASEAAWVGLPLVLSEVGGAAELVGCATAPGTGPRGRLVVNPCGDPLAVDAAAISMPAGEAAAAHEVELAEAMVAVVEPGDARIGGAGEIRAWARSALAPMVMARRYAEVLRAAARDTAGAPGSSGSPPPDPLE